MTQIVTVPPPPAPTQPLTFVNPLEGVAEAVDSMILRIVEASVSTAETELARVARAREVSYGVRAVRAAKDALDKLIADIDSATAVELTLLYIDGAAESLVTAFKAVNPTAADQTIDNVVGKILNECRQRVEARRTALGLPGEPEGEVPGKKSGRRKLAAS